MKRVLKDYRYLKIMFGRYIGNEYHQGMYDAVNEQVKDGVWDKVCDAVESNISYWIKAKLMNGVKNESQLV